MGDTAKAPFTNKQWNRSILETDRLLSEDVWEEMRAFLAVAKAGSYKGGAKLLKTSAPTVTARVRRLQDVLKAQLVVSSASGMVLTESGQQLATELAQLDHTLFALIDGLGRSGDRVAGRVRISVTEGLALFFVVPLVRELTRAFPELELEVQTPLNVNDMRQNVTDILIGFAPPDEAGDVTATRLGILHFLPVTSVGYIAEFGHPTLDTLSNHQFVQASIYSESSPVWTPWHNLIATQRIAHHSDNTFVYGMMVKAGLGIGLLGNYTVLEPAAVPLPELGVHIPVPVYASVLNTRMDTRAVRYVYEQITQRIGQENPWFADEMTLTPSKSVADDGMNVMFNLTPRDHP